MANFQGVSFIRTEGEDFPLTMLFTHRAELVEPWTTLVSVLDSLPLTVVTTIGTILVVAIEKFPYFKDADELIAYGVRILPLAGKILRVERPDGFVNHGMVSDLVCTPDHVGLTNGMYCHVEIYYLPQAKIPPAVPPSWWNERTPTM